MAAATVLLTLAGLLVMAPAPAEAQSTVTLVSNLGKRGTSLRLIGALGPPSDFSQANAFTTGTHVHGYGPDSATLPLKKRSGNPVLVVSIHSYSSGVPGPRLFTLTNPSNLSTIGSSLANYTISAPSDNRLMASTTYMFVATVTGGSLAISGLSKLGEDAGGCPGWTIENGRASQDVGL